MFRERDPEVGQIAACLVDVIPDIVISAPEEPVQMSLLVQLVQADLDPLQVRDQDEDLFSCIHFFASFSAISLALMTRYSDVMALISAFASERLPMADS